MHMILSHTFLSNYENCPRKAWHMYVAKDLPRESPTPEMEAGIVAHTAFETALKCNLPERAPDPKLATMILQSDGLKHFEWEVGIVESGTAIGFWTQTVWFRGKLDVAIVAPPNALIIDWKTGKPREDPTELQRFAIMLQSHYPSVEIIAGAYVWLNHGGMGPLHDLSDTVTPMRKIKTLDASIKARDAYKEWNPTPNPLCAWCPVRSCEHWKERK